MSVTGGCNVTSCLVPYSFQGVYDVTSRLVPCSFQGVYDVTSCLVPYSFRRRDTPLNRQTTLKTLLSLMVGSNTCVFRNLVQPITTAPLCLASNYTKKKYLVEVAIQIFTARKRSFGQRSFTPVLQSFCSQVGCTPPGQTPLQTATEAGSTHPT